MLAVTFGLAERRSMPTWQGATMAALLGSSVTWGASLGYFRAHENRYAVLSGLGRSALLGAAVLIDVQQHTWQGPGSRGVQCRDRH